MGRIDAATTWWNQTLPQQRRYEDRLSSAPRVSVLPRLGLPFVLRRAGCTLIWAEGNDGWAEVRLDGSAAEKDKMNKRKNRQCDMWASSIQTQSTSCFVVAAR